MHLPYASAFRHWQNNGVDVRQKSITSKAKKTYPRMWALIINIIMTGGNHHR
jgi:hypothetical protein